MKQASPQTEPPFRKDGEITFGRKDSLGKIIVLHKIDIEMAVTGGQTRQGLMYRKSMDEDHGMLFVFPGMEPRSFWMKNTHIPLDILYADDKGKIVTIQANTTPFSEKSVPSIYPAQYVVEVNAGFCERKNIREGDYISVKNLLKSEE
jgi:uncharacterized membrane protein (UPF0127 family)